MTHHRFNGGSAIIIILLFLLLTTKTSSSTPIPGLDTFLTNQYHLDSKATNDSFASLSSSLKRSLSSSSSSHQFSSLAKSLLSLSVSVSLNVRFVGDSFPSSAASTFTEFISAAVTNDNFNVISPSPDSSTNHKLAISHSLHLDASLSPQSLTTRLDSTLKSLISTTTSSLRSNLLSVPYNSIDEIIKQEYEKEKHGEGGVFIYLLSLGPQSKPYAYSYSHGDSSAGFTKCLGSIWTGKDRYLWIDLSAGPVDYGPALSGDGVLPRGEFHPLAAFHGRPKSEKALHVKCKILIKKKRLEGRGDFNLSNFEDGVLSSAFMVGLLVASPIFASVAKSFNPFRLIGVGLSIWTLAVIGCGVSFDFWSITICRMFVGVGEASFVSLAAPFIDDKAPHDQKSAWLAIFYMCIPTGYALGYVYGGLVGDVLPWRAAFWGEAILMLPFAVLGFVIKPLDLKGFAPDDTGKTRTNNLNVLPTSHGFASVMKDMKMLLVDKVYVTNVLGYIAYNFVLGAYSYWGPKAGYNIYKMENADMIFGGITVICGIVGTLSGGVVLDFMDSTISNAFKLLSVSTFIGALFCFAAFCFKSMYAFLALFAVGELLIFATQGPVNFINLHCVKPSLRPLAMAMSTVSIHLFGDVPSSPLVGVLQDYVNNWRVTSLVLTFVFFPAAAIWFIGIFLNSVDRYNEDSEPDAVSSESTVAPLLEEA